MTRPLHLILYLALKEKNKKKKQEPVTARRTVDTLTMSQIFLTRGKKKVGDR